jgi:hypothetical protein
MKHLLLSAVVVGLFAGPALAGLYYTLDVTTALKFTNASVSADDYGALLLGPTTSPAAYGAKDTHGNLLMSGEVGWVGWLGDGFGAVPPSPDGSAIMTIGAGNNAGLSGAYAGYRAFVQNDDDDPWSVRLFITTTTAGPLYSNWTALAPYHGAATLLLNSSFDFANVTDIGLEVRGDFGDGSPSNPDFFHISAVPIPGAALLGVLGLFAAGLKLRRFA